MVLHELVTNAQKYGSLSTPGGRVVVSWTVRRGRLHIDWREVGGPAVKTPSRRGFGTDLIEGATAHQLRGTAVLHFDAPNGVTCEIDIPLPQTSGMHQGPHEIEDRDDSIP